MPRVAPLGSKMRPKVSKIHLKINLKRHLAGQGADEGAEGTHPTPKVPQNTSKYAKKHKESQLTNLCIPVVDPQSKCLQNRGPIEERAILLTTSFLFAPAHPVNI